MLPGAHWKPPKELCLKRSMRLQEVRLESDEPLIWSALAWPEPYTHLDDSSLMSYSSRRDASGGECKRQPMIISPRRRRPVASLSAPGSPSHLRPNQPASLAVSRFASCRVNSEAGLGLFFCGTARVRISSSSGV